MTATDSTARARILVAIDIAKAKHEVLVELPNGKRRKMIVRTQLRASDSSLPITSDSMARWRSP